MGCTRLHDTLLDNAPDALLGKAGYRAVSDRVGEARRAKGRIVPRIMDLAATTPDGVWAKAEVVGTLFKTMSGLRGDAVRALVRDLATVLGRA